ncbi:SIP domain-containing protein [Agromyces protaetiae]|uniref:SIP domain-containing protein n=1 Tax=Agromyces protaetiae TaxID=2509455 RepID=UPI0024426105|nr:SIP domain-containing protein [Agromyces protaetiae]
MDDPARWHGYAAGEAALATGVRRLLVTTHGLAKTAVSFCGYWRLPKGAPAIDAELVSA